MFQSTQSKRFQHWQFKPINPISLSFVVPLSLVLLCGFLVPSVHGQAVRPAKNVEVHIHIDGKPASSLTGDEDRAAIDVAILLDTSNSMDGLINQAKSQLWKVVQKFAKTEKNGSLPNLRVSVFEYGNTNLPASEDYIRQVIPLCDDLDKVSEALFSLTTSGGDEYCGAVIGEAVKRLDWSKDAGAYKAIFIAGNERFTQGQTDYKKTCAAAIQSGIIVNTIHCGDQSTGVKGMWADGARIGEGKSMNINQDVKTVVIECPQDKLIIELNTKLNSTYLWYGQEQQRRAWATNQSVQDSNASAGMGGFGGGLGGGGGRAGAKVSGLYKFRGRDLVDTLEENEKILDEVDEEALPDEMQKMDEGQRATYLKEKAKERMAIQEQIKKLNSERAKYLAEQTKAEGKDMESTFGAVLVKAVSEQLSARGFQEKSDQK